jgi:hypothetical protein
MKILVAIPVYDSKVPVETTMCLLNEKSIASGLGDDILVEFLPGCSHPAMGRNQLAQRFVDSDFDRMVFVDSDVTWELGALTKLANMPFDFVGGCYRYKFETENYPIGWLVDEEKKGLWSNEYGLIKVASLPGGFMSLSKNVFTKIREANPGREYEHFGKNAFAYFDMAFTEGRLWGEDSRFCKLWRDAGGDIFLDPMITLTHWDSSPVAYKGNIGNWLGGMRPKGETEL